MFQKIQIKLISIVTIITVTMLFSCTNSSKEVRDFLSEQNMPIAIGKSVKHKYKDSGKVTSKLNTALLYDFSNRKDHPYNEFPKGIRIVTIDQQTQDSTSVEGDYAITYTLTSVSEIKGNVVVINHKQGTKLETNQLFWDQKEHYFFTDHGFRLTTAKGVFNGYGFESYQNLTKWIAKDITGDILIKEKEL